MGNHCFYNGENIQDLKNDFLGKIIGQMSLNYTQIEENSNILGGMFSNLLLIFQYFFFLKIKILYSSHYNGSLKYKILIFTKKY